MGSVYDNEKYFKAWCIANNRERLLTEWDYDKNSIDPAAVTRASHKNVWWKCSEGHEWQATIKNRASGTNCPICARAIAAEKRNKLFIEKRGSFNKCFPELAKQWHPTKNGTLSPDDVLPTSNKQVWWICDKGHEWEASPATRVRRKNCPYCSGRRILRGFNDLATTHPQIAAEWHPTKNGNLTPQDVSKGSSKKVWWMCEKGHEWPTVIAYRTTDNTGCPYCAKELQTSLPEQAIFFYVKKCLPDAINNDREQLKGKELDIFIPSINTAVEYDGEAWHKNTSKENKKSELCKSQGIRLIRVREKNCKEILQDEDIFICPAGDRKKLSEIITTICFDLSGKTLDVDIERDRLNIEEQFIVSSKQSSLAELYPELAAEWHPTKNGKLDASMFYPGSGKKVWWICDKGHEWQAVIESRVKGSGCPYCSGREAITGENDLLTRCPELAKEWHPTKNGDLKPCNVLPNCGKKVWWMCSKGHEWQDSVNHRYGSNRGCPYCSGKRVLRGYNDLVTTHPHIASEWHPTKNGDLTPYDVSKGSNKKVWWKCSKGHEYLMMINARTRGNNCPYCSGQKVLPGFNDLATTNPKLIDEWDFEKNSVSPQEVTKGSHTKIWWKCSKGHEWQAQIKNRVNGTNCPYCAGRKKKNN